jgi:hypothetical protein
MLVFWVLTLYGFCGLKPSFQRNKLFPFSALKETVCFSELLKMPSGPLGVNSPKTNTNTFMGNLLTLNLENQFKYSAVDRHVKKVNIL